VAVKAGETLHADLARTPMVAFRSDGGRVGKAKSG
jgi:hypothetical protein